MKFNSGSTVESSEERNRLIKIESRLLAAIFLFNAAVLLFLIFDGPSFVARLYSAKFFLCILFSANIGFTLALGWVRKRSIFSDDELTGILPKGRFEEILQTELRRSGRYRTPLSLCLVDLDDFDSFQQSFGKGRGNQLLKDFSFLVKGHIRFTDSFAHYEKDLFCILLPHTNLLGAEKFLSRILILTQEKLDCSFSAGVTSFQTGEDPSQFFVRAHAALQQAKREGKKRIRCIAGGRDGHAVVSL